MPEGQLGAVFRHIRRLIGTGTVVDLTDSQLLDRFSAARDEAAFAALLQRHGPLVLNCCRRVLGNAHDADDAFQATFLVLARKAGSIRQGELLANWLYGVAYRIASKVKCTASRRQAHERQVVDMPQLETASPAQWEELRPLLDQELSRLPAKYRMPIILRYLQGKTNEEAAREMGCPAGTLSWRLSRALDILRQRLARRGITLASGLLGTLVAENAASATMPAALATDTLQHSVRFAVGQTASGAVIVALAEGALNAMFLTKLKIAASVLLTLTVLSAGASWFTWNMLGQGSPTALAVPLPEANKASEPKRQDGRSISDPVTVNEADFQLETDAVWRLPRDYMKAQRQFGPYNIPLALRITNQSKAARQFIPWRGDVVLMAADGTPLKSICGARLRTRPPPNPTTLENGKELVASEGVRLLYGGTEGLTLNWIDITGGPWFVDNLKPGKYRVSLRYKFDAIKADQWSGEVQTKPVDIEIKESLAQAVNGLELTLSADKTETVMKADGSNAEPVKLKLTFTNVGEKEFEVPIPLWFCSMRSDLTRTDNQEIPTKPLPQNGLPDLGRANSLARLKPGEVFSIEQPFPSGYSPFAEYLLKPGLYRLKITYDSKRYDRYNDPNLVQKPIPANCWAGTLTTNELVLKVKPAGDADAGKPVNGLKLTLSADRTETVMKPIGTNAEPVKLKLTFTNVSEKPIKLNTHALFALSRLRLEVTGPDAGSVLKVIEEGVERVFRGLIADDIITLKPGENWSVKEVAFPGRIETLARTDYTFLKPGDYRIRWVYAPDPMHLKDPLAADSWTGTLTSNELVLKVKPADGKEANKPSPKRTLGFFKKNLDKELTPAKAVERFGKPDRQTGRINMGQPIRSTPIAVDGVLYIMTETHLYAIANK
jgi:RNA polymerase sigma factor (sigma-70 family)